MKKLLIILMVLMMVGCSAPKTNAIDTQQLAIDIVSESQTLNYDSLMNNASAQIKAALAKDQLDALFTQLFTNQKQGQLGDIETISENGTTTYLIDWKLSTMILKYSVSFNANNQVIGFYVTSKPLETSALTSTDKYSESLVSIGDFKLDGKLLNALDSTSIVIFVSGSGSQDMDSTIGIAENKIFEDLAFGLGAQGISSLRYNDRYYQFPELANVQALTLENEILDDLASAVEYIKGLGTYENIYILGHSLGGMLIPYISNNIDVSGYISLAGSNRNLEDIIYDQVINSTEFIALDKSAQQQQLSSINNDIASIKALSVDDKKYYLGIPASYWMSLNALTGKNISINPNKAILILQGTDDFQVSYQNDYLLWKNDLQGFTNVEFIEYPGLNHLFMPSKGNDLASYNIENNVDRQVIDDIANFIK